MTISNLRALRALRNHNPPPCRPNWPLLLFWSAYAALIVLAVWAWL